MSTRQGEQAARKYYQLYDLVLLFMLVLLIYAFNQMTLLSNRVATLIQELAIRDADVSRERASRSSEP